VRVPLSIVYPLEPARQRRSPGKRGWLLVQKHLPIIGFPITLWLFSSLFWGGRIGKYLDDYVLSVRDVVTGDYELPIWYWRIWPFFYRPLHLTLVHHAQTLFWNHDWANHLLSAVCHGLVALLLWRFLRQLVRTPQAAAAAAMIYLVFPLHYENIFWPAAVSTAIATAILLLSAGVYLRYVRGKGVWRSTVVLASLTFLITCWNEQPATGVAALPLLYLAVCPHGEPWLRRLVRMLIPWLVCGLACVVYLGLVQATAPGDIRGSAGSLTSVAQLNEHLASIAQGVTNKYLGSWMRQMVLGGLATGWPMLYAWPGAIWTAVLLLTGTAWLVRWLTGQAVPADDTLAVTPRSLFVLAFGAALFLLGWAPAILVKSQIIEPRLCYYPTLGLIVILAVLVDWVMRRLSHLRAVLLLFRAALGLAVVILCLISGLCLVAIQTTYRERYRLDQQEMAQLKALVPSPPSNSVFVPLHIEDTPARTGYWNFDYFAVGALSASWSAKSIIQQTYRRRNLFCTPCNWWGKLWLHNVSQVGARYPHVLAERFVRPPKQGYLIKWPRMIPFIVDRQARVHLVDCIRIERSDYRDMQIPLPHITRLLVEHGQSSRAFTIQVDNRPVPMEPTVGWRWTTTAQPVEFKSLWSWQVSHISAAMHPIYPGEVNLAEMEVTLLPSPSPSRLHFRVTFGEYDPNQGKGDGVQLIWFMEGHRKNPLATLFLSPQHTTADQRWVPVSISLPAHDQPRVLHLRVEPGPAGDVNFDMCRMTKGDREFLPTP